MEMETIKDRGADVWAFNRGFIRCFEEIHFIFLHVLQMEQFIL